MFRRFSVNSATLRGIQALPVQVEVSVSSGLPNFIIVGMPDAAVREAAERVRSALKACGYRIPDERIVVNLAPGQLKKQGSGFDLPIAAALLAASGQIDPKICEGKLLVGELSLDGGLRLIPGMLAYALCAREKGLDLLCATEALSASVPIEGVRYFAAEHLVEFSRGTIKEKKPKGDIGSASSLDFADIAGHETAKRAMQIAAAGNHGILMMGPPGSGKTMLASRLPSILPPLSQDEALETAVIHSVAGEDISPILAGVKPFRSPHHSVSMAGLIGGGSPIRPGEVSLAHNGVLFLDELAEFKPRALQSIRQPMESGQTILTRAEGSVAFPARFNLVAASNPCPCGFYGNKERECTCSILQVRNYQARIGGPLLDRIDVHIDVSLLPPREVLETGKGTSSARLLDGVLEAREFCDWRRKDHYGSESPIEGRFDAKRLVSECRLSVDTKGFLERVAKSTHMSGRAIIRSLTVARTIADLSRSIEVNQDHVAEALALRLHDGIGV